MVISILILIDLFPIFVNPHRLIAVIVVVAFILCGLNSYFHPDFHRMVVGDHGGGVHSYAVYLKVVFLLTLTGWLKVIMVVASILVLTVYLEVVCILTLTGWL